MQSYYLDRLNFIIFCTNLNVLLFPFNLHINKKYIYREHFIFYFDSNTLIYIVTLLCPSIS